MIERRGRERLLLETAQAIGIICKRSGQDFDGDFAVEPRVARASDFTHPARAQTRQDAVVIEARSSSERWFIHCVSSISHRHKV